MAKIDFTIVGKQFNQLTVASFSYSDTRDSYWYCVCSCGNKIIKPRRHLKDGSIKSCGCVLRAVKGLSNTRTYSIWEGMIARCYNKNRKDYLKYGKIGLKVSKRWHRFINFYEDMGECPTEYTIERIDNRKGYSLANCKWATRSEQNLNHSRNRKVTLNGKTQCIIEWSRELNIPPQTISSRLKYNLPSELILSKSRLRRYTCQ